MTDDEINNAISGCESEIGDCEAQIRENRRIIQCLEQLEEKIRDARNHLGDFEQEQIGIYQQLCNNNGDPQSVIMAQRQMLGYVSDSTR